MNNEVLSLFFANVNLESVLRFIRAPRNAEVYNGIVVLLLSVVGLALCWICIYLTKRFSKTPAASPRKLFKRLCRAHELSRGERRQLEHLARLLGLDTPAILLIDSSLWKVDDLVSAKKLQPKHRERLITIQSILYDQPRLSVEHRPG